MNENGSKREGILFESLLLQNMFDFGLAPTAVCRDATPRCCSFGRSATFSVAPAAPVAGGSRSSGMKNGLPRGGGQRILEFGSAAQISPFEELPA